MCISDNIEICQFVHIIKNHDSGFIIGIAHVIFAKILIERTPKNQLEKHPSTQNNPLVVLCNEYRSTSKYQVKRKQYVCFKQN